MKSLMLLNARKRRKSRRSRRSRRNPVGSSKAFRANFPKSMGRKRRTTRRRSTLSIRRYRLKGGRKAAIIVARNPRRRSRRSYRMNPFGGNIMSQVKSVFSKENLTLAAGGVGATVLTNYILKMPNLPMPASTETQKLAKLGYAVGIPVLGAMLTRKYSPALAKGMLFGGLVNGLTIAIKAYAPQAATTLGFSEYLDNTPMSALNGTPGYSAINQFSTVRPMNSAFSNSSAFPADAWGR